LIVPITSDRGLCGGTNSGIVREVRDTVKPNREAYKIAIIGEKGVGALIRQFPDLLALTFSEVHTPMNFPMAASIAY